MRPLAIDLFCGLGGWTEGLLSEGYRVVGFDIERHAYGEAKYPAQLVIQDVLTLHGSQFKTAALIVASPPCQEYSYMAMPWSKAKAIAADYRAGTRDVKRLTALFDACFRLQREASEAAGHHIPLVVENVRGAIPWVGRSRWNFGSFHLWGDVPALMPIVRSRETRKKPLEGTGNQLCAVRVDQIEGQKNPGFRFDGSGRSFQSESVHRHISLGWRAKHYDQTEKMALHEHHERGVKAGDRNKGRASGTHRWSTGFDKHNTIANAADGCKQAGSGAAWWRGEVGSKSSRSNARKAASAQIAKIPLTLSRHIARAWHPRGM